MSQDDILKEIVEHGEVRQAVLNDLFKNKGPVARQLKSLRDKEFVYRRLVNRQWVYYPTEEAIRLSEVAK